MATTKVPVTPDLIENLRSRVKASDLISESSPGYEDAIQRWSEAAVKRAVRCDPICLLLFYLGAVLCCAGANPKG